MSLVEIFLLLKQIRNSWQSDEKQHDLDYLLFFSNYYQLFEFKKDDCKYFTCLLTLGATLSEVTLKLSEQYFVNNFKICIFSLATHKRKMQK